MTGMSLQKAPVLSMIIYLPDLVAAAESAGSKPETRELSAFIKNDAKKRCDCFGFQRGTCTKVKDCNYKHQYVKTRDRSPSPEGDKGKRKGRGKNK